ncbi:uncharacterized protein [Montipora foliosa]|uniref:uncharacterized protein n=1 Tax=Montipora foliosa TaxID=591990 RepID=UPI0035F1DB91
MDLLLIIYRPPDSSYSSFFQDFSRVLEQVLADVISHIVISGNFGLHVEDFKNQHAPQFIDILDSFGLQQNVMEDTHIHGHTLDPVFMKSNDSILQSCNIRVPGLSDHYVIHCNLLLQKTMFGKKLVNSRYLRTLDLDTLNDDIFNSFSDVQSTDLSSLVDIYDSTLHSLIDKHTPPKKRWISIRPNAPWYTSEVTEQKRIRRNLERKWRSTRSQSDRQHYVNRCGVVIHLISSLKSEHYTNIINQHLLDQKVLFKTVNKLLQKSPVRRYPVSHNTILADSFADYFTEKIEKIHQSLSLREDKISGPPTLESSIQSAKTLCMFEDLTQDTIVVFADLSAAFDTVHHSILLSRLALRFGVNFQVIAWIESYLKDCEKFVQIENTKSSIRQLLRGVPEGSVLEPLVYVLYTVVVEIL